MAKSARANVVSKTNAAQRKVATGASGKSQTAASRRRYNIKNA